MVLQQKPSSLRLRHPHRLRANRRSSS
jgi:hypothetical protein